MKFFYYWLLKMGNVLKELLLLFIIVGYMKVVFELVFIEGEWDGNEDDREGEEEKNVN